MGKLFTALDKGTGKILSRSVEKIQGLILQKVSSAASFNYLVNQLSDGLIIPYNSWSLSPRAMMLIINHILINDVKNIVEFGSGISTIFLNNLSKKNNLRLNIISVDHDDNWQKTIKEKYNVAGVNFVHAPLKSTMKFKNSDFTWYDNEVLKAIDKSNVDFVIVDGPIGKKSPYERAGAFEFFRSELERKNFSCFLDDTNVKELKEIMNHYYPGAQDYTEFCISGSGVKYEVEPVLFRK